MENRLILTINTPDISCQELTDHYVGNLDIYWAKIEPFIKDLSVNKISILISSRQTPYFEKIINGNRNIQLFNSFKEVKPAKDLIIVTFSDLLKKAEDPLPYLLKGVVNRPDLYFVNKKSPLLELIYHYGEGLVQPHKDFKVILWGGSFGRILNKKSLNLTLDQMKGLENSFMVFNDTTCVVNLVHILTLYNLQKLSQCRECNLCKENLTYVCDILEKITTGHGDIRDLDNLNNISRTHKENELCIFGQKALLPLETALENFWEEFFDHIDSKYCSASVCDSLFLSSCVNGCPAGVDLPGTIALMQKGMFQEAVALGRENNPFLLSCGRICEEPLCQKYCQRQTIDTSIHSRALHKYAGEKALANKKDLAQVLNHPSLDCQPPTGKRIAVVGAGPAGLSNAYFLARYGHKVTVFEQHPDSITGGMMRLGIPKYRLTRDILDAEVKHILSLGVEIKYNTKVGRDISLAQLREDYDAVFIAVGAQKSNLLGIKGEDLPGVMSGIDFLAKVNLNHRIDLGQRVIVVGGGNVAIDAARSALRLGANQVKIVYRRAISDMPAAKEEIDALINEGIEILPMTNPVESLGEKRLEKVLLEKMIPGSFDSSGRKTPIKTQEFFTLPVDTLIIAVGQSPDLTGISDSGLAVKWDTINVDSKTFATSLKGVFAGGDCVVGPATAVLAVGHGQRAAHAIHQYLLPGAKTGFASLRNLLKGYAGPTTCQYRPQEKPSHLEVNQRIDNFKEVEGVYSHEEALREMERCICSVKTGL